LARRQASKGEQAFSGLLQAVGDSTMLEPPFADESLAAGLYLLRCRLPLSAIVARACQMVAAEAKRVIGEGYDDWAPLQPETLARKMMATPLLETGKLRASIEWNSEGSIGHVGSNNDKAVWHELGTSRIPPRSFLVGAAVHMEDKIHKMAARAVMAVMMGKGLHGSEMAELIHLLKHVGHALKEAAATVLDGPDDNNGRHR
jgi:phage gpG-like protein